jgi:hypothetical protein
MDMLGVSNVLDDSINMPRMIRWLPREVRFGELQLFCLIQLRMHRDAVLNLNGLVIVLV